MFLSDFGNFKKWNIKCLRHTIAHLQFKVNSSEVFCILIFLVMQIYILKKTIPRNLISFFKAFVFNPFCKNRQEEPKSRSNSLTSTFVMNHAVYLERVHACKNLEETPKTKIKLNRYVTSTTYTYNQNGVDQNMINCCQQKTDKNIGTLSFFSYVFR